MLPAAIMDTLAMCCWLKINYMFGNKIDSFNFMKVMFPLGTKNNYYSPSNVYILNILGCGIP